MKLLHRKIWIALALAGAITIGCISELETSSADGVTAAKGTNSPVAGPRDTGDGTRGNGNANDNGAPNGNDNGGGPCGPCPDFDGDGAVDLGDLTLLLSVFGTSSGNSCIDIDGDGAVDLGDLTILLSVFGTTCDNGNGNDNGVPNGNDNGVPNGNDNGVPNGNDNGVPNGNDNGVPNGNDNGGGPCPDGSTQLFAPMSGSDNEAEYRNLIGGCERFRVRVRSIVAPNTTYNVLVNGAVVGQLTTDDRGRGKLEYDSSSGGFPPGFPALLSGDVITVGPVSGVFVDDCSSNANCNG